VAVDLHVHSNRSDGTDTPSALVQLALDAGLTAIALADHDTLAGIPEARSAAQGTTLELIPAVELSVEWPQGTMHVVACWIEPGPGPLQDRLDAIRLARQRRNSEILAALSHLGMDLGPEDLPSGPGSGVIGRPHIAAALIRKGFVSSPEAAFDLYLGRGRPAYRPRERLQPAEAVALTHLSGGLAVLAHPHTMADSADEFTATFEQLRAMGMDGVECYCPDYPREMTEGLVAMARRLGMVPSGGSDYHGTFRPAIAIGVGRGDLRVPDEVVGELRQAAAARQNLQRGGELTDRGSG
jgi:predicted metal-dependent phosphoesterase TrpH